MELVTVIYGCTLLLGGLLDGPRLATEQSVKSWVVYVGILGVGVSLGVLSLSEASLAEVFALVEYVLNPMSGWVFWIR